VAEQTAQRQGRQICGNKSAQPLITVTRVPNYLAMLSESLVATALNSESKNPNQNAEISRNHANLSA
jgi:hypothetical protein